MPSLRLSPSPPRGLPCAPASRGAAAPQHEPQPEPADHARPSDPAAPCVQPQEWTTRPPERAPLSFLVGAAIWPEWIAKDEGWFGLSVDAGLHYRAFSARIEVHGDPPLGARQVYGIGSVSSARFVGTLVLCGHFSPFVTCFKSDAGAVLFPHPAMLVPASAPYGAIGGRVGVEYPLAPPWFFIRTVLDLSIPIRPVSVPSMMGGDPVFAVASPNFGLGIGVLWELGLR